MSDDWGEWLDCYGDYLEGRITYEVMLKTIPHAACLKKNCGEDCGRHGDTIAGYTTREVGSRGSTQTTIHLTPRAKEGLTIHPRVDAGIYKVKMRWYENLWFWRHSQEWVKGTTCPRVLRCSCGGETHVNVYLSPTYVRSVSVEYSTCPAGRRWMRRHSVPKAVLL